MMLTTPFPLEQAVDLQQQKPDPKSLMCPFPPEEEQLCQAQEINT